MRIATPFLLAALLTAAACAQAVESRIADRLVAAGLSRAMADCMAGRWTERLDVAQLRKIGILADELGAEGRNLTVAQLAERVRAMDDPEIVSVVTGSAVACAFTA